MKIILKQVNIIDPSQSIDKIADILIEDGIIKSISDEIKSSNNEVIIDGNGCVCSPGLFDMHVHLREPGREDEETILTGSNAAAAGGFTEIACMPNTEPAIDSAQVVTMILQKEKGHLVNVFPIGAASQERKGEIISPMAELKDAGAVAFSDDGVAIKSAKLAKICFEYSAMLGCPIIEHCEDDSLADGAMNESFNSTMLGLPGIPSVAEDLIVTRDILLAEYTGGKLHIAHISTANAVELVRAAKKKGVKVTAEVTPHHFTLTDDVLVGYDTNYKMNPPLRSKEDVEAIIKGLQDGTIDCIASDHAPHSAEEKDVEFEYAPNGILGLETELPLTLTNLFHKNILTLNQIIEKFAINPRKILNLPIPIIKEGAKANLTIFNPNLEWEVDKNKFKSIAKNSPFHGWKLKGKSVATINNNQLFYNDQFYNI